MSNQFTHGYALLIAVDQSAEPRWALPEVAKDVSALHEVLVHPARCAYPPANVRVVQGTEATKSGILAGLAWLQQRLAQDTGDNETAIVYFTGHGLRDITGKEPAFYLRPYDARQDDLAGTTLRAEEFAAEIQKLAPRRLLVLLDCCHAGGMEAKGEKAVANGLESIAMPPSLFMSGAKGALPNEGREGLESLAQGAGRAVLSSSQASQLSWLRKDRTMSIFTYHLVEALTGHAQPQEGVNEVLVSDVMGHVWRNVPQSAKADWNKTQEPDYQVSGNFPVALLLGGKGLSKGAPPDPLAPLPVVSSSATASGEDSVVIQNVGPGARVNIGLPPWALIATLGAVMLIILVIWFIASGNDPTLPLDPTPPTPTQKLPSQCRITKYPSLAVRKGPGTSYEVLAELKPGTPITPIEYAPIEQVSHAGGQPARDPWFKITVDGIDGWVNSRQQGEDPYIKCDFEGTGGLLVAKEIPPTPTFTATPPATSTSTATPTPTVSTTSTATSTSAPTSTSTFTPSPLPPKIVRFDVLPPKVVPGQAVWITFEFENAEKAELFAYLTENTAQSRPFLIGGGNEVPPNLSDQVQDKPAEGTTYALLLKDAAGEIRVRKTGRVEVVVPECRVNIDADKPQYERQNLTLRSGPGTLYTPVATANAYGTPEPVKLPFGFPVRALGYVEPTGLEDPKATPEPPDERYWIKVEYRRSDGLRSGWLAQDLLICEFEFKLLPLVSISDWPPTPTPRAQATPTATPMPTAANVTPLPPAPPATPQPPVVFGPYQVVSNGGAGCAVWERAFQLPDPRMVLDTSQGDGRGYALVVRQQGPLGSLGPGTIDLPGGMKPPVLETAVGVNGREEVRVTVPVCPTRLVVQSSSPFRGDSVRWVDHVAVFEIQLFGRYP